MADASFAQVGAPGPAAPSSGPTAEEKATATALLSRRKVVDLGSSFSHVLSSHLAYRQGWRTDRASLLAADLLPSKRYKKNLLLPTIHSGLPQTLVCSRYVRHAVNNANKSPVNAAKWTPEGKLVISGSSSGDFTLWDGGDFSFHRTYDSHQSAIRCMKWSKSGEWMVTGDDGGNVYVHNTSFRMMRSLASHTASVRSVSFSPTDEKLCTAGDDKTIVIWDFKTGTKERALEGHGFDVKSVDWNPSKSLLVSGSRDNTCKLWSPKAPGRCLRTIDGHKNQVNVVAWNPISHDLFLSASCDESIRLNDLRMLRDEGSACVHQWKAHSSEICSVAWHPTCAELFVTGAKDGSMAFWMATGSSAPPTRVTLVPAAHESQIYDLDWSPSGHMLVSGSNDTTTKFWSRSRPGDSALDLMDGRFHTLGETDVLKQQGFAMPIRREDLMKQKAARAPQVVLENLAKSVLPGIGAVGDDAARRQRRCVLLAPPTDTAAASAKALEAALMEQRRMAVQHDTMAGNAMGATSLDGNPRRYPNKAGNDYGKPGGGHRQVVDVESLPKPRYRGKVQNWVDGKGFGFIRPFDPICGASVFAHMKSIEYQKGYQGKDGLGEGRVVEFSVKEETNKKTGETQVHAKHIVDEEFFSVTQAFEGIAEPSASSQQNYSRGGGQSRHHHQQHQQQQHSQEHPYQRPPPNFPQPPPPFPPPPGHHHHPHHHPAPPPPASVLPPEVVEQLRGLIVQGRMDIVRTAMEQAELPLEVLVQLGLLPPNALGSMGAPPPPLPPSGHWR